MRAYIYIVVGTTGRVKEIIRRRATILSECSSLVLCVGLGRQASIQRLSVPNRRHPGQVQAAAADSDVLSTLTQG